VTPSAQTCPDCGGTRSHLFRETRHKEGCLRAPRRYPDMEQEQHEAEAKREEGPCPVHGFVPAVDCPPCCDIGDTDTRGGW